MTLWEERAARNEVVFRRVNEEVAGLGEPPRPDQLGSFLCECADTACVERVEVTGAVYEAVRAHPRRFLVRPGHVHEELERVVEEHDTYVVVEKVGDAGAVAERNNPRA
jgi:hypothetical protein